MLEVSLILTHDLVSHAFIRLNVGELHGSAEDDLAGMGNGGDVDDHRILQATLDITDARLNHALLLASGMIFGVLLEIAQFTCLTDVLTEFRTHDLGQVSQLFFQGASALDGHRVFIHALIPACRSCSRRKAFSGPNLSASQIACPAAMVVVQ